MKLVDELKKRLKKVPAEYFIGNQPVRREERVIGRLSNELLTMHALVSQMGDEVTGFIGAHMLQHFEESGCNSSCVVFHDEVLWRIRQRNCLAECFWVAVRREFGVKTDEIAIRTRGLVVILPAESAEVKIDDETVFREVVKAMQSDSKPN